MSSARDSVALVAMHRDHGNVDALRTRAALVFRCLTDGRIAMAYVLYYWPGIQGRGEFVRLALEEAAVAYTDIALVPVEEGGGEPAISRYLDGDDVARAPFAPPFLKVGRELIGQTSNILQFIGEHTRSRRAMHRAGDGHSSCS
jgi:hypothetical protein